MPAIPSDLPVAYSSKLTVLYLWKRADSIAFNLSSWKRKLLKGPLASIWVVCLWKFSLLTSESSQMYQLPLMIHKGLSNMQSALSTKLLSALSQVFLTVLLYAYGHMYLFKYPCRAHCKFQKRGRQIVTKQTFTSYINLWHNKSKNS